MVRSLASRMHSKSTPQVEKLVLVVPSSLPPMKTKVREALQEVVKEVVEVRRVLLHQALNECGCSQGFVYFVCHKARSYNYCGCGESCSSWCQTSLVL